MISLDTKRTVTKTEIGTRNGVLVWQSWPFCSLGDYGSGKWLSAVSTPSRSLEDSSIVESSLDFGGPTQGFPGEQY